MKRPRPAASALAGDYLEPLVRALGDPAVLAGIRVAELEPVAFQLALYFGMRRDADTAAVLGAVYERLVADVTPDARATLLEDLVTALEGGASSVLALLPVLQRERDAALVRRAALAFAAGMAPAPGDPLAGPRTVRTLLDHAEHDAVRAGLVGALLALGDTRLRPLLAGTWHALSPAAAALLLALPRTLASLLEAEWLLDWLEDADPATFAAVTGSLARLPAEGGGRVLELEREWPARPGAAAWTVTREWSPAALAEHFESRLESLARRTQVPGPLEELRRNWAAV